MRAALYTTFALVAFAFNSILCRMALRGGEADAAGFTLVRLASGAVTLVIISYFLGKQKNNTGRGNWFSAFFLFAYAICFSFAYLGLTAGTGALILFGAVQLTMIAYAIIRGERPHILEWIGLAAAVSGLVYLVLPGLAAPPLTNSLMQSCLSCKSVASFVGNIRDLPCANISACRCRPTDIQSACPSS